MNSRWIIEWLFVWPLRNNLTAANKFSRSDNSIYKVQISKLGKIVNDIPAFWQPGRAAFFSHAAAVNQITIRDI